MYLLIHLNFILLLVWTASVLSFFYNRLFRNTWGNQITPFHEECLARAVSPCSFWHCTSDTFSSKLRLVQSWQIPVQLCLVAESTWIRLLPCIAEGAAQACDRANTKFGIIEGFSICSWQWQVPSVFPDVLGDGLPDLNNIYNSSEYTGFIWCIFFWRLWEVYVRSWWICLSALHTGIETVFETRIYTLQLESRFFFFISCAC